MRQEILEAAWSLARESGLSELTLRDVAGRVGMQAPSLYSHFESKSAIYDAMFGQAWSDYEARIEGLTERLPEHPREAIKVIAREFFDYAVADLARYQLMNQRTIPGFEPTAKAYAPAVRVLDRGVATLAALGVTDRGEFDIWLAILGGLADQQLANDPGGNRFGLLLDRAIDMWADGIGLPKQETTRRKG